MGQQAGVPGKAMKSEGGLLISLLYGEVSLFAVFKIMSLPFNSVDEAHPLTVEGNLLTHNLPI